MTPDVIGVVVAAFGASATLLAGVAGLNARLLRRLEGRFDRIDARMDRLEGEVVDVKIAVARLEGPQPRLLRPSR